MDPVEYSSIKSMEKLHDAYWNKTLYCAPEDLKASGRICGTHSNVKSHENLQAYGFANVRIPGPRSQKLQMPSDYFKSQGYSE